MIENRESALKTLNEAKEKVKDNKRRERGFQESTIIAENLQLLVDTSKKLRTEVCKEIGLSYPAFSDILHGRTTPRYDTIKKIADYFGVTIDDLTRPKCSDEPPAKIPLLGSLDKTDVLGHIYTSQDVVSDGEYFALRVAGDSLEPRICNGDIIVVKETQEAVTGDYVVFSFAGDIGCKKLQMDEDGISLVPTNLAYSPMHFTNEMLKTGAIKMVGKVVEARSFF